MRQVEMLAEYIAGIAKNHGNESVRLEAQIVSTLIAYDEDMQEAQARLIHNQQYWETTYHIAGVQEVLPLLSFYDNLIKLSEEVMEVNALHV